MTMEDTGVPSRGGEEPGVRKDKGKGDKGEEGGEGNAVERIGELGLGDGDVDRACWKGERLTMTSSSQPSQFRDGRLCADSPKAEAMPFEGRSKGPRTTQKMLNMEGRSAEGRVTE